MRSGPFLRLGAVVAVLLACVPTAKDREAASEGTVPVVVATRVLAGEVVRNERLARPDAGSGVSAMLAAGKRAMTVPVHAGTVGRLEPGNYVEIGRAHV